MTVRVLEPAQNAVSALIILALLLGVVATFSLPVAASDGMGRGSHSAGTFMSASDKLTIDSPVVSEADVAAGAILIAQLVATAEAGVNNIWICPIETGWTQVERVGQSSNVVQHIWWRHIEAPQDNFTNYTFQSRLGNCDVQTGEATSIAGGMTVYSGVDTDDPVGVVESSVSVTNQNGGIAPAIATQHPAGSRVVRYFGTNNAREITPSSSIRVYSVQAGDRSRTAAAFDSAMSSDGPVDAFSAAWGRPAAWAATTVVLQVPSTSTEPDDTTPPQSTVDSGAYVAGDWTNVPVNISLNAIDTGGSAVKEIVYRADGAHEIPPTTVPGSSASLSVATDGMTTITYAAHDNAGNAESEQTFVVRIDTTAPELDGTPTTPNEHGWFNSSVTIDWTCSDALSGIYGDCPSDSVINGEGAGLSASATVSDVAGNQTTASVSGINIDWTPPVTDVVPVPGWSDEPLTISLTAADTLSGVDATFYVVNGGPEQAGSEVVLSESGVHSVTYWSVDIAGNVETARSVEVRIDTIAPSITHTLSSEPNEDGWHRVPVTITFACSDSPSGIESCTEPQTLATDGASQSVTGTAVDTAGNSASDTAIVSIDQTDPDISASRTPPANDSGWNNTSVVVTFMCDDATSGIDDCPSAETVGEGANQSVTGVATDLAGNSASTTIDEISVDLTMPEISATATTADGNQYVPGSWTNQPVTVTFECRDVLSGVASCPVAQTFGEGANQSASGTVWDIAGNSTSVTIGQINGDLTVPTIGASLTTADGQSYVPGTWARQAVTVVFSCDDGLSGVAACSGPQTFGDGANQSVTGTVTDAAGNIATLSFDNINVDTVGPVITASAVTADNQPYLSSNWTNQTVTVSFTCSDNGSGLAGPCPTPVVVSASTTVAGQSVSAQISDLAGQTAASNVIVVMVDKDAPVFTFVPNDQVVEATSDDGALVTWAAPVANDAIAGDILSSCSAASGAAFPLGDTLVSCVATDHSGNSATTSFTITVIDTQPPELIVPEAVVVPAESPMGAIVTYDIGSDVALAGVASLPECAPASGSHFKIGTTTVWCTATDGAGNSATASFTVTVVGAAGLLTTLRGETVSLVVDRNLESALLRTLDQAQHSLNSGNALRAYGSLLRYRVQVAWYARLGRLSPAVNEQLQVKAQQVVNALW